MNCQPDTLNCSEQRDTDKKNNSSNFEQCQEDNCHKLNIEDIKQESVTEECDERNEWEGCEKNMEEWAENNTSESTNGDGNQFHTDDTIYCSNYEYNSEFGDAKDMQTLENSAPVLLLSQEILEKYGIFYFDF